MQQPSGAPQVIAGTGITAAAASVSGLQQALASGTLTSA